MQLTLERTGDANRIRAYDTGSVTVNDTEYRRTTVVTPERIIQDWGPASARDMELAHLGELLDLEAEILLIGTGKRQHFPPSGFMGQAVQAGVGIECMTTEAACRTYNVLLAEGRRVAVALFMIEASSESGRPT